MRRKRISDVDYLLIRFTAATQMFVGGTFIIASGVILFALPSWAFWLLFWLGFYLFLPGAVITFKIASKEQTYKWARFMIPIWKLMR